MGILVRYENTCNRGDEPKLDLLMGTSKLKCNKLVQRKDYRFLSNFSLHCPFGILLRNDWKGGVKKGQEWRNPEQFQFNRLTILHLTFSLPLFVGFWNIPIVHIRSASINQIPCFYSSTPRNTSRKLKITFFLRMGTKLGINENSIGVYPSLTN